MTSTGVVEKFEEAIRVLSRYEQEFSLRRGPSSKDHSSPSIHELMTRAIKKDRFDWLTEILQIGEVRETVSLFLDRILMLVRWYLAS